MAASRGNGSLDSSVHETNWKSKRMKELLRRLHVIRKGTKDVMTWQLSKGDTFIVKSFYSSLAGCFLKRFPTSIVWNPWVLIRVSFFAWEVI